MGFTPGTLILIWLIFATKRGPWRAFCLMGISIYICASPKIVCPLRCKRLLISYCFSTSYYLFVMSDPQWFHFPARRCQTWCWRSQTPVVAYRHYTKNHTMKLHSTTVYANAKTEAGGHMPRIVTYICLYTSCASKPLWLQCEFLSLNFHTLDCKYT